MLSIFKEIYFIFSAKSLALVFLFTYELFIIPFVYSSYIYKFYVFLIRYLFYD